MVLTGKPEATCVLSQRCYHNALHSIHSHPLAKSCLKGLASTHFFNAPYLWLPTTTKATCIRSAASQMALPASPSTISISGVIWGRWVKHEYRKHDQEGCSTALTKLLVGLEITWHTHNHTSEPHQRMENVPCRSSPSKLQVATSGCCLHPTQPWFTCSTWLSHPSAITVTMKCSHMAFTEWAMPRLTFSSCFSVVSTIRGGS